MAAINSTAVVSAQLRVPKKRWKALTLSYGGYVCICYYYDDDDDDDSDYCFEAIRRCSMNPSIINKAWMYLTQ